MDANKKLCFQSAFIGGRLPYRFFGFPLIAPGLAACGAVRGGWLEFVKRLLAG
jgi:hypothetical protein